VKAGQRAALSAIYNQQAVPRVRARPGNVACLLLEPTAEADPFMAVTIWQTRADAEAYEAGGEAAAVVALVREFFAGPPTLRSYESASAAGVSAGGEGKS
jgi:heme-degrading monooxygenase HmoA